MRKGVKHCYGLVCCLVLLSCAGPELGPSVDLVPVVTPDPVPAPVSLPPSLPLVPPLEAGRWRVWVPRQTDTHGNVTQGTWLDLNLTAPPVEMVEPEKPMPRVPKTLRPPKPIPSKITPPPGATLSDQATKAAESLRPSSLPQGFTPSVGVTVPVLPQGGMP